MTISNKLQNEPDQNFDIVKLILQDHIPLKKLIKVLKKAETLELKERKSAFEEFEPLLISHAKPEEQVLYRVMKDEFKLRTGGFEGETEHGIADRLLQEVKTTQDNDQWSARAKVLAELVEHHIEEEEDQMLPNFKKKSTAEERVELGREYLEKKSVFTAGAGLELVTRTRQWDYADSHAHAD